jgi:hypothetical protein
VTPALCASSLAGKLRPSSKATKMQARAGSPISAATEAISGSILKRYLEFTILHFDPDQIVREELCERMKL